MSNTTLPELQLKYKNGDFIPVSLTSSKDVAELLATLFDADTINYCESFIVILLNQRNKVIGWRKVSQGGISMVIADPRIIFSTALIAGAASIIVSHNHPSGECTPSQQDIKLTERLKIGGDALSIKVLDHLIIAPDDRYYSFSDEGLM